MTPDQAAREAAEKAAEKTRYWTPGGFFEARIDELEPFFKDVIAPALAEREAECERVKKERNDAYQALQDRSLREHAALEELLTKNDTLAAEAERLRGEKSRAFLRIQQPMEDCPFCESIGNTGSQLPVPMCRLCAIEADKESLAAENAALKEQLATAMNGERGYYESLADTAEALGMEMWGAEEVAPKARALREQVEKMKRELPAIVLRASFDPGQFTPRGDDYNESIHSWSKRAVEIAVGQFAAAARGERE